MQDMQDDPPAARSEQEHADMPEMRIQEASAMNIYDWKYVILITCITGLSMMLTVTCYYLFYFPLIPQTASTMITSIIGGIMLLTCLISYKKILVLKKYYEDEDDESKGD